MKPSVIKTHLTCLRKYPDIISRLTRRKSQWGFSGEGGALSISWGLFIGCIFLFKQVDRRITSGSGVISGLDGLLKRKHAGGWGLEYPGAFYLMHFLVYR